MNYIKYTIQNFFNFEGRSSRSEYWIWWLATAVVSGLISRITPGLSGLFSLIIFIPGLSVLVRRLHDTSRSAWSLLWLLLPIIGHIYFFVLLVTPSVQGANNYGYTPDYDAVEASYTEK